MQHLDQQINSQENTKCLEQQFYASPENFTPALLVMLETFRRSVLYQGKNYENRPNYGKFSLQNTQKFSLPNDSVYQTLL